MDAFIVLILIIIIICWACYRRKFSTAAYGIAAVDLLLRIVNFIAVNLKVKAIQDFFAPWPNSILGVTAKYTKGLVYSILAWSFVILMIYFLFLTLRSFFKK
jgi:hypothetical protein